MYTIKETKQTWQTPAGATWNLCNDILEQTHVVIGGTTGSGKSTLLHSIMYSALIHSPVKVQFIIIDLKQTEMWDYKNLPHTIAYAEEPQEAIDAINITMTLMRNRLAEMRRRGLRMYDGSDIYLVIDEMAVLMQTAKAKVLAPLADIMRLGRAAKVHVIGATQNPSRTHGGGLPAEIAGNATAIIGLRCRSRIESNMLIAQKGCEDLPMNGYGYYWNSTGTNMVAIPKTSDEELQKRINYWRNAKPIRRGA